MYVKVYHNVTRDEQGRPLGMLDGFELSHQLVFVAEFKFLSTPVSVDTDACNEAFRLFNVGDDPQICTPDPVATEYRERGNRSLSVGDVVEVGDAFGQKFYACARFGWTELSRRPNILDLYGTCPPIYKAKGCGK